MAEKSSLLAEIGYGVLVTLIRGDALTLTNICYYSSINERSLRRLKSKIKKDKGL